VEPEQVVAEIEQYLEAFVFSHALKTEQVLVSRDDLEFATDKRG
jgi:hypothetical protein